MGLTARWHDAATSRAHVLVAEAPGAFGPRVALERAVTARGWTVADTVADADVLVVVGAPGPRLTDHVDHVWEQMSEPRARVRVGSDTDLEAALSEARETLRSTERQRGGANRRARPVKQSEEHDDAGPDGIPLAEGAEDRDGLEMDELHLPLGPVLAHWPAGVVLRLTLHGDVVAGAEVQRLDPDDASLLVTEDDAATHAARLLDAAASVLTLSGLGREAARATRLRDALLLDSTGRSGELESVVAAVGELVERVRRHRVLRWVLKDLAVTHEDGRREELHDRLVGLLERARGALRDDPGTAVPEGLALEALPALVDGQELSAVRLWMAALGADLARDLAPDVDRGA